MHAGGQGSLHDGWQSCTNAISTALHPDVNELIRLLSKISTSTTPIFGHESSCFSELCFHVEQVRSLSAVDFAHDGADSLSTILKADLQWVEDEAQFAARWNGKDRVLRQQLPEIRKAITQWQHNIVTQWEATGYRHDNAEASCLVDQLPIRLHIDGNFVADALDSADLACMLLHPASSVGVSQVITAAGTYQLTVSR